MSWKLAPPDGDGPGRAITVSPVLSAHPVRAAVPAERAEAIALDGVDVPRRSSTPCRKASEFRPACIPVVSVANGHHILRAIHRDSARAMGWLSVPRRQTSSNLRPKGRNWKSLVLCPGGSCLEGTSGGINMV